MPSAIVSPALRRRLVAALAVSVAALAEPSLAAGARKPARAAAKPAPAVVAIQPLPISCSGPLAAPKTPDKPGLGARLKGAVKGGKAAPRLPDSCVLAGFADPAFPVGQAASPGLPIAGLFSGRGPMPAAWPATTAALQEVLDDIAAAGPRPSIRPRVVLVADRLEDARAAFEGAAGEGGVILVTTGLVQRLYDQSKAGPAVQDQLRFILASEYGHVLLRHPQRMDTGQGRYDQAAQALQMANAGLSAVNGSGRAADPKARDAADLILAAGFISDLEAGEPARYRFPQIDPALQRDADLLAVDILARKGADARAGAAALTGVWTDNKAHVAASAALRDQAGKASAAAAQTLASVVSVKSAPVLVQKLQLTAAAYAAGFAARKVEERREMADVHLHDDAEDRVGVIADYLDAFYPDPQAAVAATPAGKRPLAALDFTRVKAEVEGHRAAERAEAALAAGDVALARAEIDAALASPVGGNVDVQLIASAAAIAEGRSEAAQKRLEGVLAAGYRGAIVYQKLALAHRMTGDDATALAVLEDGAAGTGDAKPFMVDRLAILRARNDEAGVSAALRDCVATQDVTLAVACQKVASAEGQDMVQARAAMARVAPPPAAEPPATPAPAARPRRR